MKTILLLLLALACVSCAEYSGATYGPPVAGAQYYAGNGDAGGADPARARVISEYKAKAFMTDLKAGKFGPKGATVAGQNQSKVPLSAIRTAGTIASGIIAANLAEAVSNNGSAEVINQSNNALSATQAKEATKQLGITTNAAVETAKIPPAGP